MAYTGTVLPFDHNGREPIIERLAWLTTVSQKRNGAEQRQALRTRPRREFEYSFLPTTKSERAYVENFMWGAQASEMLIPIWSDAQTLQIAATSGASEVSVATPTRDYDPGGFVLLWRNLREFEAVEIAAVGADTLTLAEPLENDWPATETVIVPARFGRLSERLDGTAFGANVKTYKVPCLLREDQASVNRLPEVTPRTYLGVEVWEEASETSEQRSLSFEASFNLLDFSYGLTARDAGARDKPFGIFAWNNLLLDRLQITKYLAFLERQKGRLKNFWLPTFETDFDLQALNFGSFDYTRNGFADLVNAQQGRRDIAIYHERKTTNYASDSFTYKRLASVANLSATLERATVSMNDYAWFEVEALRIGLLKWCRLEGDTVEIAWQTPTLAQSNLVLRESFITG